MRGIIWFLLRGPSRAWGAGVLSALSAVPHPTDQPQVHAGGEDADRILIVGTGAAVGWGVLSYDLAFPGALAREISRRTGRGVDIDVLADPWATAVSALKSLKGRSLWRYDAVMLTVGFNEAVQFASVSSWRRTLSALVDWVSGKMSVGSRVYILGAHGITPITTYDRMIRFAAELHRSDINLTSEAVALARANVTFMPVEQPLRGGRSGRGRTAEEYRAGAQIFAATMAPELDHLFAARRQEHGRDPRTVENAELDRQEAVDSLDIVDTPAEERFDRIVALARKTFGTSSAALTIIDGDRQWQKSGVNAGNVEISRSESICNVTIQTEGALVVADASIDPRFGPHTDSHSASAVRFYAGYPVESPTGEKIGVICVFDNEARNIEDFDSATLQQFALLVQRELWDSRVTR